MEITPAFIEDIFVQKNRAVDLIINARFFAHLALHGIYGCFAVVNRTADCFVEYNGIFYDITRVDTFEGCKEDLKLYAIALASASQPGAGVIIPWGE